MIARGLAVLAAACSVVLAGRLAAQDDVSCGATTNAVHEVPALARPPAFAPGERLEYAVSFGKLHVGSASMTLAHGDTIRGHETWRGTFAVSGGFWKFSVHDSSASWFDPLTFTSLRFVQEVRDPGYRASRHYELFPDRQAFQKRGDSLTASVPDPLDDVSIVYLARTLPLAVGECYALHRYFVPDRNPVVIRVLRRDTIDVPAGRFPAIVVQPEIRTTGIFSKNGRAELWLSDDAERLLLQLKSRLSFGSINLYLKTIQRPATTGSR